ncbi:MAG: hypothetical protein HOU81_26365 [Hamadaea sp.]|uniref:hypothetical protein n=1 Tax=Hamadaea sp. TaxID=2024425 RepID=UPI001801FBD2|nr:hypothetical protein [Hamadaea sp.]NUR74350.1 hypothetical protein [Hamadaea sp.]NUT20993.1 hypothetical protein [Hamadaea sp.]
MPTESEAQAAQRRALLAPVARLCLEAGVPVRMGRLERPGEASVVALTCAAPDGTWDAALTVVRARPVPEQYPDWNGRWGRDPRDGYDLSTPGTLVFELQITEEDDGSSGHGPRPMVVFELLDGDVAAADSLILWWRRPALFHTTPPGPHEKAQRRRERAEVDRHKTRQAPPVRLKALPGAAEPIAAQLDAAALSGNFPRAHDGRFHRSAVVALTPIDGTPSHRRGAWLTARRTGDGLTVTVEELIGGNQEHRWDLTPWLWSRAYARTSRQVRWQVSRADRVRPIVAALRAGDVPSALQIADVAFDEQVAKLLAGAPTRTFRAEYAERWVTRLYEQLAESAPWRFAEAYRIWQAEADRARTARPVTLFGLKGLNQARKPKIALTLSGDRPMLRLVFTASNLVLPRSLWTLPTDFPE